MKPITQLLILTVALGIGCTNPYGPESDTMRGVSEMPGPETEVRASIQQMPEASAEWATQVESTPAPEPTFVQKAPSILEVPSDFPTIQSAINAAQPGDEIVVADGIYPELVNLRNYTTLRARNRHGATIDGGILGVGVHDTRVSGFRITGFGVTRIVRAGIILCSSPNNVIEDNLITEMSLGGIYVNKSNNRIVNNEITHNKYGMLIEGFANIIENNIVANNAGEGITFFETQDHIIVSNEVSFNASAGIQIDGSTEFLIEGNRVESNGAGIVVNGGGGHSLVKNTANGNDTFGISLFLSNNNLVEKNTARCNAVDLSDGGSGNVLIKNRTGCHGPS